MKLRTRVAVLAGVVAAIAVITISVAAWFIARSQMRASVDDQLGQRAEVVQAVADGRGGRGPGGRRPGFLQGGAIEQRFGPGGLVISVGEIEIPISDADRAVARGELERVLRDEIIDDLHLRVLTVPVPGEHNVAVTFATPLTQVDDSLTRLRRALAVLSAVGIVGAALAGFAVARRSLRPVERLTLAAEHVAATHDLAGKIEIERSDELGSLAGSFNKMLAALAKSRQQQHQLVTDASHELRTPLTSLRTNVELLQRAGSAADDIRDEVMDDVVFELDELTSLVAELVELATDRYEVGDAEPVDLSGVAARVVERHRRRTSTRIDLVASSSMVRGIPALLERAVSNLVDNAVKFSPEDGSVTVIVGPGRVEVSDDGPGIAEIDRSRVFDRFWRAEASRTFPGSGLGLAIAKQVAEDHEGSVELVDHEPPGATFLLRIPEIPDRHEI